MKRFAATFAVLFAVLFPACSLADPSVPSWCEGVAHQECQGARADLLAALQTRYGDSVVNARPLLENCPVGGAYNNTAYCMAYFEYRGTYRFLQASVTAAEDASGTAKLSYITTWRRKWRKCSLRDPGLPGRPRGTLLSNQPCGALPMEPVYTVMIEMGGGSLGVGFVHHPGWQFTESAYFGAGEMTRVSRDTCAYKNNAITCSDKEGDSFRYTY